MIKFRLIKRQTGPHRTRFYWRRPNEENNLMQSSASYNDPKKAEAIWNECMEGIACLFDGSEGTVTAEALADDLGKPVEAVLELSGGKESMTARHGELVLRMITAGDVLEKSNKEHAKLQQKVTESEATVALRLGELDDANAKAKKLQGSLDTATTTTMKLREKVDGLEAQVQTLQQANGDMDAQLENKNSELSSVRASRDSYRQLHEVLTHKNHELHADLALRSRPWYRRAWGKPARWA